MGSSSEYLDLPIQQIKFQPDATFELLNVFVAYLTKSFSLDQLS